MRSNPRVAANVPAWLLTGIVLVLTCGIGRAQNTDFQIVWVVIGEAAAGGDEPVRAGKHLFMATDLANLSLQNVNVARVDVEPTDTSISIGTRFCLTALNIIASAADRSIIEGAPLSVSVRQDHRDSLGLERGKDDICIRPSAAGEFPVRFASLLPAADGSMRGAQIFIRVHDHAAGASRERPSPAATHR